MRALAQMPLRVHQDIVVTHQMLVEPGETVVLLPAATRYEQGGGGTATTTERRVAFSPEIPGPRVGEARSEWEIFADVARRVAPERADLFAFAIRPGDPRRDRARRARVRGDRAAARRPATRSSGAARGSARAACSRPPTAGRASAPSRRRSVDVPDGQLRAVDPARQAVQLDGARARRDPLTGAARDALFLAAADATALGVPTATRWSCAPTHGEMRARVHVAPIRPGNVQAFFPEGNVLLRAGRRDAASGVPDYNTVVDVEAAPR